MKESQFQKEVLGTLKKHNIWFIKYWGGGAFTKEGVPDILACINGQFHGIELKTDAGTETKLQAYNLDFIRKNNGMGYILRPSKKRGLKYPEYDYEEMTFKEWLEKVVE